MVVKRQDGLLNSRIGISPKGFKAKLSKYFFQMGTHTFFKAIKMHCVSVITLSLKLAGTKITSNNVRRKMERTSAV
jgi:hypothetical protein